MPARSWTPPPSSGDAGTSTLGGVPVLDERLQNVIYALDPDLRLHDFTIGLVDSSNIVFFAALTVLFLLAAVTSLQVRR